MNDMYLMPDGDDETTTPPPPPPVPTVDPVREFPDERG